MSEKQSNENKRPRPQGAVCTVVRAEARADASGEFAAILSDLAHRVRNEEDGCTAYYVTRAMGAPDHFAVHARFTDWAAFKGHAETAHLKHAMPRLTALLAAPWALEIYFEVS